MDFCRLLGGLNRWQAVDNNRNLTVNPRHPVRGDSALMKLTLVATVVAACILFGSSNAEACDPNICEGTVEATGKGIVVEECNFLHESQLQKGCAPGSPCRVKSTMNKVLKVCPLGSRCHVEAEFGRTSETICAIKRL